MFRYNVRCRRIEKVSVFSYFILEVLSAYTDYSFQELQFIVKTCPYNTQRFFEL